MRSIHAIALSLWVLSSLSWAVPAQAGVIIEATRVIYPAGESEVTVKLDNQGAAPVLVQAWMDNGDPRAAPETIKVPFNLTPPMARMQPKAGQVLRMIHSGEPMTQDRESLYWLNVYEIPSKPAGDRSNSLQVALRSRIKVFYRPEGLQGEPFAAEQALRWSLVRNPEGTGMALKADNPTPYHVSFQSLGVKVGDAVFGQPDDVRGGMVAPFSAQLFALKGLQTAPGTAEVVGKAINDFGGFDPIQHPLTP
ncbi:fimbria/pilus periplasmic chaperone [Stenotrophomonas rhizophila]|uniref:fimbria/pilus periplasmic chaperone n=1 Tax=Stenotrophomonas rhizophila TaxID=216778 RepID=UPI001E628AA0|nr:fimbria/pilus periplasmic chaperone [Stenotrophomonas rhizophila]MCC7634888.1 fimbria/pilus periplasmic chaperone [Stenotrophomonas rhizophila]MCC7664439.1 fimbria/pilus periplasmic chaperone [Stenotrophomonas rhizophila]